ncbi:MAG: enoyl-CoA hydratase/isomerase family protein [Pacificimonas sp.]|jgi:enoyl-CoA hydratase/carnithine racemase|nr:enoyl-CoA hydratase/isomerase family protein [Pacificimonas sp.]
MSVRLDTDGPLATISIDRPNAKNAFNQAMWLQLVELLRQAGANDRLRLLVLRSSEPGSAFSAGADIKELLANKDDAGWRSANQAAINRAQYELTRFARPTLAFIEGDCVGGGCGIALACDLRLAAPAARFAITPAKLGLVYPLHDVKLLTDLIGPGQAKRLLFTGELIGAEEALRIGLVEAIGDDSALFAEPILAASPHSTAAMKRFVRRVLDGQAEDDEDTLRTFAEAFTAPDFAEGTAAFIAKRPPRFGA